MQLKHDRINSGKPEGSMTLELIHFSMGLRATGTSIQGIISSAHRSPRVLRR